MSIISIERNPKKRRAKPSAGWIYCPESFQTANHPGPIADHPDAARWLLNVIHFKRVLLNYSIDQLVQLHSQLLALVMGKTALVKPIRDHMEREGLIECDHDYAEGVKCLGYRLGPRLKEATFRKYTSNSKRFVKRVAKFKQSIQGDETFKLPVHHHLKKWLDKFRLPSDLEDTFEQMASRKAELARHQAECLNEGYLSYSVCGYDRFHSSYTGLCRELRERLSYQGRQLVEIDICNSQPYFLGLLLLEVWLSGGCLSSLRDGIFESYERSKKNTNRERDMEHHTFSLSSISRRFSKGLKNHREKGRRAQHHTFSLLNYKNGTLYRELGQSTMLLKTCESLSRQLVMGPFTNL